MGQDRAELPLWQREALQRAVADLTKKRGGQTSLAGKVGVSQAMISKLVTRGEVGHDVAGKVLAHLGTTFEELAKKWHVAEPSTETRQRLRDRAGWAAVRDQAFVDNPHIPREFIELAGDTVPAEGAGDVLDPLSIAALAVMYFRTAKRAPASTSRVRLDVEAHEPGPKHAKR